MPAISNYFERARARTPFCDAVQKGDPTGTADIRRRYSAQAEMRFRKCRLILQQAIVAQDILGLKAQTVSVLALAASMRTPSTAELHGNLQGQGVDSKIKGLQNWFDDLLARVVLEKGEWLRPMIATTWTRATARAMRLTGVTSFPNGGTDAIAALTALCKVELQGIMEALSQRVMREASLALINASSPIDTFRQMADGIQTIGITRARAMIEVMVVKTHATATLDQFEGAGLTHVGLVPEMIPMRRDSIGDAKIKRVPKRAKRRRAGPGARSRKATPSRSTIARIRRAQAALPARVNVATAGDDQVCSICEDIEDGNPYTIDTARTLIPAHVKCRCAFVPA